MSRIRIAGLFILAVVLWIAEAYGAALQLKTGMRVEGKIVEKTDEFVKIELEGVVLTYYADEIESVDDRSGPVMLDTNKRKTSLGENISKDDDPTVIDDPPTARALSEFNQRIQAVGKSCALSQPDDRQNYVQNLHECYCHQIHAVIEANEIKAGAFMDLLKRRPELKNKLLKIKDSPGRFLLNPDAFQNIEQTVREQFDCQ